MKSFRKAKFTFPRCLGTLVQFLYQYTVTPVKIEALVKKNNHLSVDNIFVYRYIVTHFKVRTLEKMRPLENISYPVCVYCVVAFVKVEVRVKINS